MPPTKGKPAQIPAEIADNFSLEKLQGMFDDFVANVENQIDAENAEDMQRFQIGARTAAAGAMQAVSSTPEEITAAQNRRDALVALIFALESQEARIRAVVKNAEVLARRYKTRAEFLKSGVAWYMRDRDLQRIEGFLHRFAIHRQPDQLIVTNENAIPARFFDEVPVTQRTLNKERLLAALTQHHAYRPEGCVCGAEFDAAEPGRFESHLKEVEVRGAYLETNRTRLDVK